MKKHTTTRVRRTAKLANRGLTIGIDLGDRSSCYCVLDGSGEIVLEQKVSTTAKAIEGVFGAMSRSRVALETGTHSPWVSRLLSGIGHQVIVANARNMRRIGESRKKDDRMDAQTQAKLVRIDPQLLAPVKHRSAQAQMHLTIIRARTTVVRARTAMINAVRGLAKSNGERLRGCNSKAVNVEVGKDLNASLQVALRPLLEEISALSLGIRQYNKQIEELSRNPLPGDCIVDSGGRRWNSNCHHFSPDL